MSDDRNTPNRIRLLRAHRTIVIQQLHHIQNTIREIDQLLEPHNNNISFQINDRVVSHIAPNKNKVGLVTKVTDAFIHVAPLDTRLSPYKKAHKNLSRFTQLPTIHNEVTKTEITLFIPLERDTSTSPPPSPLTLLQEIEEVSSSTTSARTLPPPPSRCKRTAPTLSAPSRQRLIRLSTPNPTPASTARCARDNTRPTPAPASAPTPAPTPNPAPEVSPSETPSYCRKSTRCNINNHD